MFVRSDNKGAGVDFRVAQEVKIVIHVARIRKITELIPTGRHDSIALYESEESHCLQRRHGDPAFER